MHHLSQIAEVRISNHQQFCRCTHFLAAYASNLCQQSSVCLKIFSASHPEHAQDHREFATYATYTRLSHVPFAMCPFAWVRSSTLVLVLFCAYRNLHVQLVLMVNHIHSLLGLHHIPHVQLFSLVLDQVITNVTHFTSVLSTFTVM